MGKINTQTDKSQNNHGYKLATHFIAIPFGIPQICGLIFCIFVIFLIILTKTSFFLAIFYLKKTQIGQNKWYLVSTMITHTQTICNTLIFD